MPTCKCACCTGPGCHCLDYDPREHCDCSLCSAATEPARSAALALSAQAGEDAHNRERVRWGLSPVVTYERVEH